MTKKNTLWISLLIILAVIGVAIYATRSHEPAAATATTQTKGKRGGDPNRTIPIQAALITRGDMDVVLNALGTVNASNTVTVHSRVDGQLLRLRFREGQMVKAGEILAEIEPRPFQAQFDQAQGQLARDEAQLLNAKLDLGRYQGLLVQDSIAKQQVDAQAALVRQYQGTLQSDQAQVASAKLQLTYAKVTAPISGRLGLRQIDAGNIVHAGDANGLVVITQAQPIAAVFSIPSDNLPAVASQLRDGKKLAVEAWDRGGQKKLADGSLLTVDNQIDSTTGSVKIKAEFGNQENTLFPNQFVNIRLRVETRHGVTLAPNAAIQRGTPGTFVYIVKEGRSVDLRPVTLGQVNGDQVAIAKGLMPGEQIVIDGADKLRQGAKVEVVIPTKPGAEPNRKHAKGRGDANGPGANRKGTP
jgi:multidrug efflux system membrane fusion protein